MPKHLTLEVMPVIVSPSDGYFNPEVVKYRQLCAKSQRKRQLYSLQQYYHRLLKQILVSRKVICVKAYKSLIIYSLHVFTFGCILVVGTSWVCSSQWSGLSTKKEVTLQNPGWNAGAKGEKTTEPHIKGGQSWVWRQQCLIWWWWLVRSFQVFRFYKEVWAVVWQPVYLQN